MKAFWYWLLFAVEAFDDRRLAQADALLGVSAIVAMLTGFGALAISMVIADLTSAFWLVLLVDAAMAISFALQVKRSGILAGNPGNAFPPSSLGRRFMGTVVNWLLLLGIAYAWQMPAGWKRLGVLALVILVALGIGGWRFGQLQRRVHGH